MKMANTIGTFILMEDEFLLACEHATPRLLMDLDIL